MDTIIGRFAKNIPEAVEYEVIGKYSVILGRVRFKKLILRDREIFIDTRNGTHYNSLGEILKKAKEEHTPASKGKGSQTAPKWFRAVLNPASSV